MGTYVLVHGAWHGAWCWNKIIPLLEKGGYRVEAPDLPGHGSDKTPIRQITLEAYTDRIAQVLAAQPEPVILVGHSLGGVVISQVAEYVPGKIKKLVYLTAFLARNGESLLQLLQIDAESLLLRNLIVAEDQTRTTLKEESLKEVLYGRCSDADIAFAKMHLVPEAVLPSTTPVNLANQNFGRIPRVYVSCLRDRVIGTALQEKMYTALPCEKVMTLDTDHSPFFSAPEELAGCLLSL